MVEVRVLGGLDARVRGRPVPAPAHPQGPELLGWLALHPGEHPRGPLAALLWPDVPRANARASLRSAVWALRRALGPAEGEVLSGRDTIGLRCTTDLQAFEQHLAAGDVEAALALCRGALLAGLEEHAWVLAARAAHAERVDAARAQQTAG
jgi:DNA-binding SARP family transcriptional activator